MILWWLGRWVVAEVVAEENLCNLEKGSIIFNLGSEIEF